MNITASTIAINTINPIVVASNSSSSVSFSAPVVLGSAVVPIVAGLVMPLITKASSLRLSYRAFESVYVLLAAFRFDVLYGDVPSCVDIEHAYTCSFDRTRLTALTRPRCFCTWGHLRRSPDIHTCVRVVGTVTFAEALCGVGHCGMVCGGSTRGLCCWLPPLAWREPR